MTRIKNRDQLVDIQILDNESIEDNISIMKEVWKVEYQLILPNIHFRNAYERSICTFKAHLLVILSGIYK